MKVNLILQEKIRQETNPDSLAIALPLLAMPLACLNSSFQTGRTQPVRRSSLNCVLRAAACGKVAARPKWRFNVIIGGILKRE